MITFENKGDLDIRAVKTFGVSSKLDKSTAIGYFGTGLKYAIAILLRHHHTISIITGGKTYSFDTIRSKIRNDTFDIVTMNGEELGFTTELGKDWELWMAFREIYSNMLDENGEAYARMPIAEEGNTYVLVCGPEFEKVFEEKYKYFLDPARAEITHGGDVQVYAKAYSGAASLFFRGIKASETPREALYDYNFTGGLQLSEDRSLKSAWDVNWKIAGMVVGSQNKDFIEDMVMASRVHEDELNYMLTSSHGNSDVFLDVVGKLRKVHADIGINATAVQYHQQHTKVKDILPTVSIPLSLVEMKQLDKAKSFCRNILRLDIDDYKLIVVKDLGGSGQLGRANIKEGIMYVSRQCFKEGTKRVATALLEEYTHCKYDVQDETVEQKWVYLNQILSLGEEISGEPL